MSVFIINYPGGQIKKMIRAGHVARAREDTGVHRVLVWKPGRKRPLARYRIK